MWEGFRIPRFMCFCLGVLRLCVSPTLHRGCLPSGRYHWTGSTTLRWHHHADHLLANVMSGTGGGEDDIWWWGDLSQLDIFDQQLSHWQRVCVPGLCAHPPWRERPICNPYFRRRCKQRSRGLCAAHVFFFVPISMEHISTDHPYSLDTSRCETFDRRATWQHRDIPMQIYVWKVKWRRTGRSQHSQGGRRGKRQQGPK